MEETSCEVVVNVDVLAIAGTVGSCEANWEYHCSDAARHSVWQLSSAMLELLVETENVAHQISATGGQLD